MPKYSRTAKYEDLRSRLQSDAETDIKTNDLNAYEARLNKVDSANFSEPQKVSVSSQESVHAKKSYTEAPVSSEPSFAALKKDTTPSFLSTADTYTRAFDNEYLNQYINEVKQYNVDQGNDFSGNTDMNILKRLKGETPSVPASPYPEEKIHDLPEDEKVDMDKDTETIEVPFAKSSKKEVPDAPSVSKEIPQPKKQPVEYLDEEEADEEEDETYTKEDIASEVKRLISGSAKNTPISIQPKLKKSRWIEDDDDDDEYDDEDTRQRLLNETSQMRAQMDDYEDNLNQVSDKMQKTNQILNIVLIVLIIALIVVLGVVIYWVLMSKGIL